jgi:transmembrane sensor
VEQDLTYNNILLTRYFSGETSPEEDRILVDWVKSDPKNNEAFIQFQKTWLLLKADQISSEAFIDSEWKRFEEATLTDKGKIRTLPSQKSVQLLRIKRYVSIAAVFLVLAISSLVLVKNVFTDKGGSLLASTSMVEGKLPDGTLVSLNSDSRIDFESFKGSERKVKLVGEAWFEVAHNAKKPFIVTTGDLQIKVLGTAFYVNARNLASKMELVLMRGRVAVYYKDNPDEFVILEPGEKVEVAGDHGKIIKKRNDDENCLAWKTKRLIFKDMELGEAVKLINDVYKSNLVIDSASLGKCRISAEFDNQTLDAVLNVLEATLGIKAMQEGNRILLKGPGCN